MFLKNIFFFRFRGSPSSLLGSLSHFTFALLPVRPPATWSTCPPAACSCPSLRTALSPSSQVRPSCFRLNSPLHRGFSSGESLRYFPPPSSLHSSQFPFSLLDVCICYLFVCLTLPVDHKLWRPSSVPFLFNSISQESSTYQAHKYAWDKPLMSEKNLSWLSF